ncbi:Mu-like prophage major head subunit gpT family protein [Candidatus Dojkabacteria bacterium]|jgi:phage major head subunit gpT-like protein|nr:Mu-like prophage major head subunit gpT family protein [Candidatus Dojkabacteria bacterium]
MSALRDNFGDLLEPGLRKIFDDKFKEIPEVYSSIFHVDNSSVDVERDSAITGFSLAEETAEGGAIQYENPVQMYDVSYVHKKYTKGFKVSEELMEDDRYSIIKKKPAALARTMRRTSEYLAANVFNNGFSSGTGGDGKYLFSVSHTRADAGTAQSNASGSGITLTETNLNTALLAMRSQLDDKGMKVGMKADTLIVPAALEKTAAEITNSSLRSGTANNDSNYYKGMLKVIGWDWLSSSTAWFLMDSTQHELNYFWRVRPEFKQDNSFDTGMALFKARMRCSQGWSDWRGVWGSAGDGASYTS